MLAWLKRLFRRRRPPVYGPHPPAEWVLGPAPTIETSCLRCCFETLVSSPPVPLLANLRSTVNGGPFLGHPPGSWLVEYIDFGREVYPEVGLLRKLRIRLKSYGAGSFGAGPYVRVDFDTAFRFLEAEHPATWTFSVEREIAPEEGPPPEPAKGEEVSPI